MSDLHLVPDGDLSNSIDTFERLTGAINYINTHHNDASFCILNGDLADNGVPAAYERLKSALTNLDMPTHITLGNHDDGEAIEAVFGAERSRFDQVIEADGHHIFILNSQDPGKSTGRFDQDQITWIKEQMQRAAGKPVIVALHHPIGDLGTGLDFLRLQNPEPFIDLLKSHGDVRQVISGHIHTTTCGVIDGIPFSTLAGNHYNFSPFSNADISHMQRIDGPGELAVVMTDMNRTVVHFDKFHDKNQPMPNKLFTWNGN